MMIRTPTTLHPRTPVRSITRKRQRLITFKKKSRESVIGYFPHSWLSLHLLLNLICICSPPSVLVLLARLQLHIRNKLFLFFTSFFVFRSRLESQRHSRRSPYHRRRRLGSARLARHLWVYQLSRAKLRFEIARSWSHFFLEPCCSGLPTTRLIIGLTASRQGLYSLSIPDCTRQRKRKTAKKKTPRNDYNKTPYQSL